MPQISRLLNNQHLTFRGVMIQLTLVCLSGQQMNVHDLLREILI